MEGNDFPLTLLTLPLELRQMIYEHTFQGHIIDISEAKSTATARNAGLLLACRQMHFEAIKRYYTHSIFYTPSARRLGWLGFIPLVYRNRIQDLRVKIDICQTCIIHWSTSEDVAMRYLWRKIFRDRFIVGRLAKRGIHFKTEVLKVNVELYTGRVIWSAEPENWKPQEWEEVPEDEEVWEIEEMAKG